MKVYWTLSHLTLRQSLWDRCVFLGWGGEALHAEYRIFTFSTRDWTHSLEWTCQVLTTGLPGKPQVLLFKSYFTDEEKLTQIHSFVQGHTVNTSLIFCPTSFQRQGAAFQGAWCPLPAFRTCSVELARCSNVLSLNLWGRKWSPRPIPLPSQDHPSQYISRSDFRTRPFSHYTMYSTHWRGEINDLPILSRVERTWLINMNFKLFISDLSKYQHFK